MKKAKTTGDFAWSLLTLTSGRVVEAHYTYLTPHTKLAVEFNGYSPANKRDLIEYKPRSPILYTESNGTRPCLTEEPQGAEAVAWYEYQAYAAHRADFPLDVMYALLMAEYHKDTCEAKEKDIADQKAYIAQNLDNFASMLETEWYPLDEKIKLLRAIFKSPSLCGPATRHKRIHEFMVKHAKVLMERKEGDV